MFPIRYEVDSLLRIRTGLGGMHLLIFISDLACLAVNKALFACQRVLDDDTMKLTADTGSGPRNLSIRRRSQSGLSELRFR